MLQIHIVENDHAGADEKDQRAVAVVSEHYCEEERESDY